MNDAQARAVLARYDLAPPVRLGPVARRENAVWRVETARGALALRCHRAGYRSAAELASELDFMAMLAAGGLTVPAPIRARDGGFVVHHAGRAWSLLTWLPGTPLGRAGTQLPPAHGPGVFARLGATLARLHALADGWTPPAGFTRPDWRAEGLVGETP
ncbi:MAG: homoserine kinase, partial [Alphaproteobacteria bacterium]